MVLASRFVKIGFVVFGLVSTAFGAIAPAATPAAITSWCGRLSKELLSVKNDKCTTQQWKFEDGEKSALGFPIPYMYWGKSSVEAAPTSKSDNAGRRVLIIGAIHGDEISAVSLVFRWIDFLERTKTDSFLRDNYYMFLPLANPDGFFTSPRTRMNKAGVDLNRNFSTKEWAEKALLFWKKKANSDPRRFPGKTAASEHETRLIEKAINDFKPDLIISVHAPYRLVDHDGPIMFPAMESPLPVRTLGAYPGSLGTYAGVERNIPVVTPELPSAKTLPDVKSVEQLFIFIMKAKY